MDIEFQFCKVKNFWRLVAQPCDHVNILNIAELNRQGRKSEAWQLDLGRGGVRDLRGAGS